MADTAWSSQPGPGDDIAGPAGSADAAGPGADPRLGAHEALLVRHGLITHVAEVPADMPGDQAARFRSDLSRVARNVIPLSERRFGLLLAPGPRPEISRLPHVLHAAELSPARADSPSGEWHAQTVARPGAAASAAADDEDRAAAAAPRALSLSPTDPGAVAGADHDNAPAPAPAPALDPVLAARLDAIEAQLAAASADAISAQLEARLDTLLTRRLEAVIDRLPQAAAPAEVTAGPPVADALAPERVSEFWSGMEQALRLLHGTAGRLEAAVGAQEARAGDEPGAASGPDATAAVAAAVAGLEDAISLGLEASEAARADQRDRAEARFSGLDVAVAGLETAMAEVTARVAEAAAVQATAHDLRATFDAKLAPVGDDVAGVHATMRQIAEMLAVALERVDHRMDVAADRLDRVVALVEAGRARDDGGEPASERLDRLEETLTARGGVLSDALETSKRSMKNFWLAAEDVLQRLDAALGRLEAVGPSEVPSDTGDLPEAARRQLAALEAGLSEAASGLATVSERQAALDGGTRQVRRALAELLARDLRAGPARAGGPGAS